MNDKKKVYESLNLEDKAEIIFKYLSEIDPRNFSGKKNEWKNEFKRSPILAEEYYFELFSSGKIDAHIKDHIVRKEKNLDSSPEKTNCHDPNNNPWRIVHPAAKRVVEKHNYDLDKAIPELNKISMSYLLKAANSSNYSEWYGFTEMAVEFQNARDYAIIQSKISLQNRHFFSMENDLETREFDLEKTDDWSFKK